MKKLLAAFAIIAVLLPFAPKAESQDFSVEFFYNNLNGGSWIEVGNYGYCWQPDAAVSDTGWRPYSDGYWAYTDDGWTWISYEDFGWATYHYGRWVRLADYGWIWVPGYEWGPAWVSWRTGGNYIGWAPLPPETEFVYTSRPLTGHLDIEFDIGPAYYNFVDVRFIGEPVLRSRIVPIQQNVTYINQTVNVTNITYKNKTVYNYGPDINVVNQYSTRPIQRLKLERQTNVDVAAMAKGGGVTRVQGNALVVAAPRELKRAAKNAEPPPPAVKTKVAQPKLEKGWSVAGDENAQRDLKQKIKTQNLKNVPPPTTGGGAANVSGGASASPAMSASPATSAAPAMAASPVEKGKGKGKGKGRVVEETQTPPGMSPAGAGTSPSASPALPERGKKKGKGFEQTQPGAMTSPAGATGAEQSPSAAPEFGKRGKGKRAEQFGGTPPPSGPTTTPEGMTAPEGKGKRKGFQNVGPTPGAGMSPTENLNEPRGKHKQFEQQPLSSPGGQSGYGAPATGAGPQGQPPKGEARGKRQIEQPAAGAPAGETTGGGQQTGGGKHQGKKQQAGESPSPTPQ
jgi:hypothetical protein